MKRLAGAFSIASCLISALAHAQTPSRPDPNPVIWSGSIQAPLDKPPLKELTAFYFLGDWVGLQERTCSILAELATSAKGIGGHHEVDCEANTYLVVFVSTESSDGSELIRYLVHRPAPPEYTLRLDGRTDRALYEVFLDTQGDKVYETTYWSTREANPLVEQLPKFLAQFDPKALALLIAQPEAFVGDSSKESHPLSATLRSVSLPFRRAKITVKETLSANLPTPDSIRSLNKKATALAKDLALRQARGNPCALELTILFEKKIKERSSMPPCGSGDATAKCWSEISKGISDAYEQEISTSKACRDLTPAQLEAAIATEAAFKALVVGPNSKPKGSKFTLVNRPSDRLSFGVLSAWMADTAGSDVRVKLDDGKLMADPLTGYLGLGILNIHPFPYDREGQEPTGAQRLRFFVGGAVSPEFGIGAGVGYELVKGLNLNVGVATLLIDSLRPEDELDAEPVKKDDPFDRGTNNVFFFGFSYNF